MLPAVFSGYCSRPVIADRDASSSPRISSARAGSSNCWTVSAAMSADMPASSVTAMRRGSASMISAPKSSSGLSRISTETSAGSSASTSAACSGDSWLITSTLSATSSWASRAAVMAALKSPSEMVWVSVITHLWGCRQRQGRVSLKSALRPPLSANYVDYRLAWSRVSNCGADRNRTPASG